MTQTHERRPELLGAARTETQCQGVAQSTAVRTPVFAVLVRRELANGGMRTSLFRTIAPAERAVERAAKQGLAATVEFMRLVPVEAPSAADLDALGGGDCE